MGGGRLFTPTNTHYCESANQLANTCRYRGLHDQCYKSIDGASVSPLIVFIQQAKSEQNSTGNSCTYQAEEGQQKGALNILNKQQKCNRKYKQRTRMNDSHGGSQETFIDLMSIFPKKLYMLQFYWDLSHNRVVLYDSIFYNSQVSFK